MTALAPRSFLGAGGSVVVVCSVVFLIVIIAGSMYRFMFPYDSGQLS